MDTFPVAPELLHAFPLGALSFVNGHEELTHFGHQELTHPGGAASPSRRGSRHLRACVFALSG
jgi:hypothetical protein